MGRARAGIAAGALVLALACAYLVVEAGRRAYETLGPSHAVAAADGSLYVVSHGRLHVFAPTGRRSRSIDLAAIGAPPRPSDVALHADGRLVLVDPDTSRLVRCRLPSGPCESLDLGLRTLPGQEVLPLNAGKLAIDEAAGRYYVSDNAGHRVVIADFAGHVLARSPDGMFRYPNHIAIAGPGAIAVVDTNHHRIVTLDVRGDRFGPILGQAFAGAGAHSRPGRRWPFDSVALPDGRTAVLVARDHMRDADLLILDREGRAQRRIDLGADSDPFDIERWGDRLVVADGTRYTLQALSFDGAAVQGFPPADFVAELGREHRRAIFWRDVRKAARIALIAVPLAAIALLLRFGASADPFADRVPPPVTGGSPWIAFDPAFVRRERRIVAALSWVAIPCILAAFALFAWIVVPRIAGVAHLARAYASLALLALAPFVFLAAMRDVQRRRAAFRMRATDEALHIVAAGRGARLVESRVPWSEVRTDGARILAGRHVVPLRNPVARIDLFDRAAIDAHVVARIPAANRLSSAALTRRVLRARPLEAAILAAALAGVVAVLGMRALGHL